MSAPHRSRDPRLARTPLAVITGVDDLLRDAVVTNALLDEPGRIALRYDVSPDGDLHRLVISADGVHERQLVELEHACLSCAMREDALPILRSLAQDDRWGALLLALPVASDPSTVAPALAAADAGFIPTSVTTVLDSTSAHEDLLGDDLLSERGLCWGQGDERAVGEALAAQIAYCDVLIDAAQEPASAGAELVEHLRSHEQRRLTGVHEFDTSILFRPLYRAEASRRRIDPCTVEPWGGPQEHGTWTLDLTSERPFHPERFLEQVEALGTGELRSRGRLWFPTRPQSICQWDGAGGQVSIGTIAHTHSDNDETADVRACLTPEGLPTTRLVVTGIHAEDFDRVREAFAACLLTEVEWARGLEPWLGQEDQLTPWLGARAAA